MHFQERWFDCTGFLHSFFLQIEAMMEEDNRLIDIRPRYTFVLEQGRAGTEAAVRSVLERYAGKLKGTVVDHHVIVDVPVSDRHFWSPQLHFRFEDEGECTRVHGVVGPRPAVWTMFMFIYFSIGILGVIASVWGVSHWMLGGYSPLIWGLPVAFVVMATAYGAGRVGETLGKEQVALQKRFLQEVIQEAGGIHL